MTRKIDVSLISASNISSNNLLLVQDGNVVYSGVTSLISAGQNITIDANGRINSTATGGGDYGDANVYANISLLSLATNANVALKANIADLTTDNVTELTNLYFTNTRVYSNVTELGYITASTLSGYATNAQLDLYATNSQLTSYATNANAALKANIVDLTTANVTELTNLYFSNARVVSALTAGQSITIDANGRINSTATSSGTGSSSPPARFVYFPSASQTSFSGSDYFGNTLSLTYPYQSLVFYNGIVLTPDVNYTSNSTHVVLSQGADNDAVVTIFEAASSTGSSSGSSSVDTSTIKRLQYGLNILLGR